MYIYIYLVCIDVDESKRQSLLWDYFGPSIGSSHWSLAEHQARRMTWQCVAVCCSVLQCVAVTLCLPHCPIQASVPTCRCDTRA